MGQKLVLAVSLNMATEHRNPRTRVHIYLAAPRHSCAYAKCHLYYIPYPLQRHLLSKALSLHMLCIWALQYKMQQTKEVPSCKCLAMNRTVHDWHLTAQLSSAEANIHLCRLQKLNGPDCHVWYLPPWTESYLICLLWLDKESVSRCQGMVNKMPCTAFTWDICSGRRHTPETIATQRRTEAWGLFLTSVQARVFGLLECHFFFCFFLLLFSEEEDQISNSPCPWPPCITTSPQ